MNNITRREAFHIQPAPNARTIADLPRDASYNHLLLNITKDGNPATLTEIIAAIAEIKIRIGSDQKRLIIPSELAYVNQLNGKDFAAGFLGVYFREFWLKHIGDQDHLKYGMQGVDEFQMEIVWKNYAGTYAVKLSSEIDELADKETGTIPTLGKNIEWHRRNLSVTHVSGESEVLLADLSRDKPYRAIHFLCPTNVTITEVEVKVGDKVRITCTTEELEERLKTFGFKVAEAKALYSGNPFSIVFANTQRLGDSLSLIDPQTGMMARKFEIKLRVNNQNTTTQLIDILTETIDGL